MIAGSGALKGCGEPGPCADVPRKAHSSTGSSSSGLYAGHGDPFQPGDLAVRSLDVAACDSGAPVPLRIHIPKSGANYPVVVFQHGFMSRNSAYDEVLIHLASHGFVVVAPQMYQPGLAALFGNPTAAAEAERAADVLEWVSANLDRVTGFPVRTDRLGIAGHSRGGKVAWLLAVADPTRFLAIAGLDPVDGAGGPLGNQSRVVQGPFSFSLPALIVGTELAGSCAPAGDNHIQFYQASQPPAWHVVALNHGHGDMLDEADATAAAIFCSSGPDRAGMRRLTAGLLVALFRAALQGDAAAYEYLSGRQGVPISVTSEFK